MNNTLEVSFSPLDRHFARLMRELGTGTGAGIELELAAKLVSFFSEKGHICLPLEMVAGCKKTPNGFPAEVASTPELNVWLEKLEAASVIGGPHDFTPLVLDGKQRLYLRRYWDYERLLGRELLQRAESKPDVDWPLLVEGLQRLFPPNPAEINWQKLAAFTAVARNLSVISGGPGTGKTRTVVVILALLLEQAKGKQLRVALCAPTGKAAARLKESIQKTKSELGLSPEIEAAIDTEATTIHRLLGYVPDSTRFRHNRERPLLHDVVIVDEASMIDLALMAKLIDAVKPSARLVLLGDKDQLASVESGAALGDICNNGEPVQISAEHANLFEITTGEKLNLPETISAPAVLARNIVELRKNYRFGSDSGIYQASSLINSGDADGALAVFKNQNATDLKWAKLPKVAELKPRLNSLVLEQFSAFLNCAEPAEALVRFNQFRILCALKQGPFGVPNLNEAAEEILADAGLIQKTGRWYRGRPVMITRNDYNLKLFNGDIGIILSAAENENEMRAWFVSAEGKLRQFLPSRLPSHETVFAMTIHKSQGSEFQNVLMILPDHESPILTRELVYTGVTRARKCVELWADDTILRGAIANRIQRSSGLREELWDAKI